MYKHRKYLTIIFSLALTSLFNVSMESAELGSCLSSKYDRQFYDSLKTNGFATPSELSNDQLAMILSECLGEPDPDLRDGIAYEGLVALFRENRVSDETKKTLLHKYYSILSLKRDNTDGFIRPFTALAVAEIARSDRKQPFLNASERSELVSVASDYLISIRDYRGFNEKDGWRHGIAHAADILMQLSLNKNITQQDIKIMMEAILYQVRQHHSAYVFGEPSRLARPVLYLVVRNRLTDEQWDKYVDQITKAQPLMKNWDEMYKNSSGLILHHNVKAFLSEIYINTSLSKNENLNKLTPKVAKALRALP